MADLLKQTLDKFDGKNFHIWRFKLEAVLVTAKLWDVVTEVPPPPAVPAQGADPAAIAAYTTYRERMEKTKSTMTLALSDNEIARVINCRTPKQMMDVLDAHYANRATQNLILLQRQLVEQKLAEGGDLDAHLRATDAIYNELQIIGHNIPDSTRAVNLLVSLPPSYASIVDVLSMSANLNYNDVKTNLVNHALLRKLGKTNEKALYNRADGASTRGKGKNRDGSSRSSSKECYYCKKKGHMQRDCRKKQADEKAEKEAKEKKNQSSTSSKANTKSADGKPSKEEAYLTVHTAFLSATEDGWYIDSGATRHMCNVRHLFSEYRRTDPIPVRIGDSTSIAAEGEGSIIMDVTTRTGVNRGTFEDVLHVPNLCANLFSPIAVMSKGVTTVMQDGDCWLERDGRNVGTSTRRGGLFSLNCIPVLPVLPAVELALPAETELPVNAELTPSVNVLPTAHTSRPERDDPPDAIAHGEKDVVQPAVPVDNTDITPSAQIYGGTRSMELIRLWHCRFGHASIKRIARLANEGAIGLKHFPKDVTDIHTDCVVCAAGKSKTAPKSKKKARRSDRILGRVHADLSGPMGTPSRGGALYYGTFIDDATRFSAIYFQKRKSETFSSFQEYEAWATNLHNTRIGAFHTDNGGEYTSDEFRDFFKTKGIQPEYTASNSPHQNGVPERRHQELANIARCLLQQAGLGDEWWAEAYALANWLVNRLPTIALQGETPFERWAGRKPDFTNLHMFGCRAEVLIEQEHKPKLAPRTKTCMYLGPNYIGEGCRFYDPLTKRTIVSRSATYFEVPMLMAGPSTPVPPPTPALLPPPSGASSSSGAAPSLMPPPPLHPSVLPPLDEPRLALQDKSPVALTQREKGSSGSVVPTGGDGSSSTGGAEISVNLPVKLPSVTVVIPPLPAGIRIGNPSSKIAPTPAVNNVPPTTPITTVTPPQIENVRAPDATSGPRRSARLAEKAMEQVLAAIPDPKTVEEALNSAEAEHWKKAMDVEYDAVMRNKTWTLTHLPEGRKAIPSKWVFKRKIKSDGSTERYKGRIVAKGYSQRKGLDFKETFAPVARMTSMRFILALAAHMGYKVYQSDVDSAYLNSLIDTLIFMTQPEGYVDKDHPDMVCQLNKSLYGLKQAGRLWFVMYRDFLLEIGFIELKSDSCIYIRRSKEGLAIIGVYVDDTIKTGDEQAIKHFNKELNDRFSVKELGLAEYVVGIQLTQDEKGISLSQSTYITGIAESLGLTQTRTVYVPISETDIGELRRAASEGEDKIAEVDSTLYRSIIGRCMYAMVGTRPDIAYALSVLGQYASKPREHHLQMARKLVSYLYQTREVRLTYTKGTGTVNLEGYTDADWGSDPTDRRSISGYIFTVNGTPISWSSKRQATTALSSTEAEYMAATLATKEAMWLRRLLSELGHGPQGPTTVYEDNQGAIAIAQNPVFHQRTKHIDIQYHFTRERVEAGDIKLVYIPTADQLADICTKALSKPKFTDLRDKLFRSGR